MGYESLSVDQKSLLQEVARQAYGIAGGEGAEGGEGRIGLMKESDGTLRAVKYNTHLGERLFGSRKTQAMIDGANDLRTALLECAINAKLDQNAITEIRRLLGLEDDKVSSTSLLDRKIVAKVLTKIGGQQLWKDAVGTNGSHAEKSAKDMSFEIQEQRTAYGVGNIVSAKGIAALEKLGITVDGLSEAVNNLAAAKGIDDAKQKAVLMRLTATYLASRAEQDESELPPAAKLYKEIFNEEKNSEVLFTGAKFALFYLRKIGMKDLGGDSAHLLKYENSSVNDYFLRLDEDECEFAAAMLGRLPPMDTRKIGNEQWYGVSALFLHQVLAKRPDIEKLQAKNGSLSFDDLCGVLGVNPKGENPPSRLIGLMNALERNLADRMQGVDGVNIEYFGDFQNSKYETLIARYGMSPEEAVRQLFGNPVAFKLKDNITVFDPHGSDQGKSVSELIEQLAADLRRTNGTFEIGGTKISFVRDPSKNVTQVTMTQVNMTQVNMTQVEMTEVKMTEVANQIAVALCKMLGCSLEDNPPNERLKMLLIACGQGGNEMLNASGVSLMMDHAETHKSFVLKDNKDVVYTVRYESKQGIEGHNDGMGIDNDDMGIDNDGMGIDLSATCVIKPDCTNKMTNFVRHPKPKDLANDLVKEYSDQFKDYRTLNFNEKRALLLKFRNDIGKNWLESGQKDQNGYPEFCKEVSRECIKRMPGMLDIEPEDMKIIEGKDEGQIVQELIDLEQYFGRALIDAKNRIDKLLEGK